MSLSDDDMVTTGGQLPTTGADADGTDSAGADADGTDSTGADADGRDAG